MHTGKERAQTEIGKHRENLSGFLEGRRIKKVGNTKREAGMAGYKREKE